MTTLTEVFGEVISSYSRRQAIEDGVLVDLMQGEWGDTVRESGFKFPIAMTATAFAQTVWPIEDEKEAEKLRRRCQDLKGRLWDVLHMLLMAIRQAGHTSVIPYKLTVVQATGRSQLVHLKAVCGPGDQAEPVITIMLPNED